MDGSPVISRSVRTSANAGAQLGKQEGQRDADAERDQTGERHQQRAVRRRGLGRQARGVDHAELGDAALRTLLIVMLADSRRATRAS